MPVPPETRLVVLVGGTFDPPHRAHVELPARVRDVLEGGSAGAWLVYVPAARSPFKTDGPVASDADRVKMLTLALEGTPRACVWTDEIDRAEAGEPSYTVDTLERARRWLDANGCAGAAMRLLIGADQALAFHRWREPRRIISLAEPVVMLRPPVDTPRALVEGMRATGAWSDAELGAWESRVVDVGVIDAAATSIRERLASGGASVVEGVVDPRVLEYIREHGLYHS